MNVNSVGSEPEISIIMPLYNKETYVGLAIESVLKQTFSDFELIVVNDGSTDNSLSIAKAFSDTRIRVLDCQNQGVSVARNRGFEASVGEYIAFLDADDVWFDRHLEVLMGGVESYPGAGIFANRYTIRSTENEIYDSVEYFLCDNYPCASLNSKSQIWTSAVMIKRNIFAEVGGFPVGESHGEDLAVWMRASLISSVVFSNYLGAYYRQTSDGLSSQLVPEEDGFTKALKDILESGAYNPVFKDCLSAHRARISLASSITAYAYGEKKLAIKHIDVAKELRFYNPKYFLLRAMSFIPSGVSSLIFKLYIDFYKKK